MLLRKGDSWKRRISFKNNTASGSALNLTGASFQANVVHASKPDAVLSTGTVVIVDAPGGLIDLSLSSVQQQPLAPGAYDKDPDGSHEIHLRLTDGFGDVFTVLRLKLQLTI